MNRKTLKKQEKSYDFDSIAVVIKAKYKSGKQNKYCNLCFKKKIVKLWNI